MFITLGFDITEETDNRVQYIMVQYLSGMFINGQMIVVFIYLIDTKYFVNTSNTTRND